jgi:hypothetical protein
MMPSSSGTGQFIAHGVRQKQDKLQRLDLESLPEEDRLWARILIRTLGQCGDDTGGRLLKYVRAIVEGFFCKSMEGDTLFLAQDVNTNIGVYCVLFPDMMDISLKLISDLRYNKIEEDAQNPEKAPNARDKAWMALKPYLEELYGKYGQIPANSIDQCPAQRGSDERFLRIVRLRN